MSMRLITSIVWCVLINGFGLPPATYCQTTGNSEIRSDCRPSFPYKDGWLGGDAGYSIPLAPGRSLWLFGDSFIGNASAKTRSGARFVRNSIAISSCRSETGWQIDYYWRNQNGPHPTAFFESHIKNYWYWPLDGFVWQNHLYVAIAKLKNRPSEEVFSFKTVGVLLAKVSNLAAPPNRWRIQYLKLTDDPALYPGSSIVLSGNHAYFFTVHETRKHQQMILTRVALDQLDRPSTNFEYLARDKSWKHGLRADAALGVIETGHSELSVRYHPESKQWLAVSGGGFLSNQIMIRTAPELTGPWSAQQAVYEFPEMDSGMAERDPDTWCYAVKEHNEFGSPGKLLVTYACNSFKLGKLISNMNIYRPQSVTVALPNRPE